MHVFVQWEEAGEPAENSRIDMENMQTLNRKATVTNRPRLQPATFLVQGCGANQPMQH